MNILDIETRSLCADHPEYALQPWRLRNKEMEITHIAYGTHEAVEFIKELPTDCWVGAWNAVFDVACLYAAGYDVDSIAWVDVMLVCKWVDNMADHMDYSLVGAAKRHLQDWKLLPQFIKLKAAEDHQQTDKYWAVRAKLDVVATSLLGQKLVPMLTMRQRRSMLIEAGNIVPNAKAWVNGLPTNPNHYTDKIPSLSAEMAEIECRLGVSNVATADVAYGGPGWTPSKILRSPKQLADLLYVSWQLPCDRVTPKGIPSTDKTALTYLADKSDHVLQILRWRHLNTLLTKFCQSPMKAAKYLGSPVLHPAPKLFSTYTGRYTYSSRISDKYPVAMALHQIPRGPEVRRMVEAPPNKMLVEFDASGQEARLVAQIGNVDTMLEVFAKGQKFHAVTGAKLAGDSYEDFMVNYKSEVPAYVGAEGYYNLGKFINLSMMYRVGAKKQRLNARVQYGINRQLSEIEAWRSEFHSLYPGVKKYWDWAIQQAQLNGYAETLAGRRCYIEDWYPETRWASESTAINFPIQGSGGDMKNLAISKLEAFKSQAEFAWDLHDGLFYWVPREKQSMELIREMKHTLDTLDYEGAWGWTPTIPMPWDAAVGLNWGEMRHL